MPMRYAAWVLASVLGPPAIVVAHAQSTAPTATQPAQAEATGACTITSRGNQQKTCMVRVPQASCAANAREQRTTFEWQAGAECP